MGGHVYVYERLCAAHAHAHTESASHDWSILLLYGPLVTGVDWTVAGKGR